ncbi:MAG TPA: sigma-70 family RNA polymerase sigma factor [Acidimicrobiales bacterium]|nr:sigma-70 family RNA polymerase sigma factor [Acidimicrobiales bacterium]
METGVVSSLPDLVARARDGDEQAWGDLVRRYLAMVQAICRGYRLSGDDAADVNQVVWLRLVEHLVRIRNADAVGGWIAATTRNECRRVLRVSGRTVPVGDDSDLDRLDEVDGHDPGIDTGLLVYERDRVLSSAFGCLDDRCQQLLRLLMADPRPSYDEIAAALDMPVGSIGPTRGRCLDHLRRLLG